MTLTLRRISYTEFGIFGYLFDLVGNQIACTLEHGYLDDGSLIPQWLPKMPSGTYRCVRGPHNVGGKPFETFEITGVPGHTGILLHCGNVDSDSSGCVLVGNSIEGQMITESRLAFGRLMNLLAGVDSFDLVVK